MRRQILLHRQLLSKHFPVAPLAVPAGGGALRARRLGARLRFAGTAHQTYPADLSDALQIEAWQLFPPETLRQLARLTGSAACASHISSMVDGAKLRDVARWIGVRALNDLRASAFRHEIEPPASLTENTLDEIGGAALGQLWTGAGLLTDVLGQPQAIISLSRDAASEWCSWAIEAMEKRA